jgi:hypothetical protein
VGIRRSILPVPFSYQITVSKQRVWAILHRSVAHKHTYMRPFQGAGMISSPITMLCPR